MDMNKIVKEYTNGEVTIVWKSELCAHSGNCVRGLKDVFNIKASPLITPTAASTEAIIEQINKCPSGALSYYINNDKKSE